MSAVRSALLVLLVLAAPAGATERLPPYPWAVSFDAHGTVRVGDVRERVRGHVEAVPATAMAGTRRLGRPGSTGVVSGSLRNLLITRATPEELLLHRLAALHARTPAGRFPYGEGPDGRLRFSSGWTSGFWPGALWNASDIAGQPFTRWALAATRARAGAEDLRAHDLGFMFGLSTVAAHSRRCPRASDCPALRQSGLDAANGVRQLVTPQGLTMSARTHESDVIVDSLMNLEILGWAWRETGVASHGEALRTAAEAVSRTHVREDGSTVQSVHFDRSTGAVLRRHTHQGLADESTWARGQAWAVHGFAQAALDLGDATLARTSERAARFIEQRLPRSGIPRYDYDAGPGAPDDVSAGVVTAAGLLRLERACRQLAACEHPGRWRPLATRMLRAAMSRVSRKPPLGRLGDQALTVGGVMWDDRAELVLGLHYALAVVVTSENPQAGRGFLTDGGDSDRAYRRSEYTFK